MAAYWITDYTVSCAAGVGLAAVRDAIARRATGLRHKPWAGADVDTWLGPVPADLEVGWPDALSPWDSRNNRLAWLGLQQDGFAEHVVTAIGSLGAERIGLIVGTSTSSIGRTEDAYAHLLPDGRFEPRFLQPAVHNPHSTGAFLADVLGICGPVITISRPARERQCAASADRWLRCGSSTWSSPRHNSLSVAQSTASIRFAARAPLPALTRSQWLNMVKPRLRLLGAPLAATCSLWLRRSCDPPMSSPHPEGPEPASDGAACNSALQG